MNVPVTSPAQADFDLITLRDALKPRETQPLVLEYAGRTIQAGYHVTEIKFARLSALDCGGNPDNWIETILQVEDIPAQAGGDFMTVGKFLSILGRVEAALGLDQSSRVTFEVSRPDEAMQVFDIAGVDTIQGHTRLVLEKRPAICKPRHRAAREEAACCGSVTQAPCCA